MANCTSLRLFSPITSLQESVKHYIFLNYDYVTFELLQLHSRIFIILTTKL